VLRRLYRNFDDIDSRRFNLFRLFHYFYNRNRGKDLISRISINQDTSFNYLERLTDKISYTWIGHSTFFIQMNGLNIITDPVFSKRMGLEKRLVPLGIPIEHLPEIDVVLISHAHYDHLDFSSIRKLKGNPHYFVPIGVNSLFKRRGFQQVTEANWWDHFRYETLDLHFVPAQHWSRRGVFDKNRAHWGGWIIKNQMKTFYFVGDTAYFRGFKQIGKKFEIDTVFMPIGDYEPDWLSGLAHINPEKAIQAFQDLGASTFIPMHYGTYRLSMDTGPEALDRLYIEWEIQKLAKDRLQVLKIGETILIENHTHEKRG
jgi:L-ascorbate metabolism protein UlaG (beta-lactamase superfamily)